MTGGAGRRRASVCVSHWVRGQRPVRNSGYLADKRRKLEDEVAADRQPAAWLAAADALVLRSAEILHLVLLR